MPLERLLKQTLLAKVKEKRTVGLRVQPERGAKGAEAPFLAKSRLEKKIKYRIVLSFFVFQ